MAQESRNLRWVEENWSALVTLLTAFFSVLLSPFVLDIEIGPYVTLVAFAIFGLWFVWTASPIRLAVRILTSIVVASMTIGWGYLLYWSSQPHFDIEAFDTLESDKNAYELTDQLIWGQNNLDEYGVTITFTLQIRPIYFGRQKFGKVIALIPGTDGNPPLEKPLWDDFTKESSTEQIQLILPELLRASGLKTNSDSPGNPFRPGDLPFQQAKLKIEIVREADKTHPWDSEEITVRNAPWDLRADLVRRDGRRELDVYVKNLGGTGEFTVRYCQVRLEEEISTSSHPMWSGTTLIDCWNEPTKLVYLEKGQYFTDTVSLPSELAQGRYLLEIYPVKKQNYVQFEDPNATWEKSNSMKSPWLFSGPMKSQKFIFVVTTSEFAEDATIQEEWERLRDEQGIDLGIPIGPVEEVTSGTGTVGRRQVFQEGEIYVHDDLAYALYGPALEHYRGLGGVQYEKLGFPISPVQAVTSSSGTEGTMVEFEGQGPPHMSTMIYASKKGVAATWQWIRRVYSVKNGGHSGWLGFPLADEQYYSDSTIQMFESGYIVYHYPHVEGDRDWGREPVAYPYLASRGALFDVHAQQLWQDTGVQVRSGDRVTIVQVGGSWTNAEWGEEPFDANGNANVGLREGAVLPSALIGALIGRIGEDDGYVFSVGRWSVLTSPAEGTLYLAMNDVNYYEDNAGFLTVQIMVDRSE